MIIPLDRPFGQYQGVHDISPHKYGSQLPTYDDEVAQVDLSE